MGVQPELERILEAVVRALSTATRSLRLYPPTSTIPRQTVDSAVHAIGEFFQSSTSELSLAVAREGFAFEGQPVAAFVAGSLEFANTLRDHGVAQMTIAPEVTALDLLTVLSVVSRPAEDIRGQGGISAAIGGLGVQSIQLADVRLVVVDSAAFADVDPKSHLRQIADSTVQLGTWFTWASSNGRETLRDNIDNLVEVAGEPGKDTLADGISDTFHEQPTDNKDALFSLALEPGHARDVTRKVLGQVPAEDIASSILGGTFGRNMLSLSSALTNLPFEQVGPTVRKEVLTMLPGTGHGPTEQVFLDHMIDVRTSDEQEPALVESDGTFQAVVSAGQLNETDVARAREVTTASTQVLDSIGARTMLALLDSQTDFKRYCESVDSVASLATRLLGAGKVQGALQLFDELAVRETGHPEWAELPEYIEQALARAAGPESAGAIVAAVASNHALAPAARQVLRFSPESMSAAIAETAITHKADGIRAGEELLGRRMIDQLNVLAARAQWYQLEPVVHRLLEAGDARSLSTIGTLLSRPEEQARRKVVAALAEVKASPAILALLGSALRDPSEEVAALAARSIAKSGVQGGAALIASRLNELDMDNSDFTLARELIGALARTPERSADEALSRLASRRAFIKHGHFVEVQNIVSQAIELRQRGGVAS
jgi:hypothetical protein